MPATPKSPREAATSARMLRLTTPAAHGSDEYARSCIRPATSIPLPTGDGPGMRGDGDKLTVHDHRPSDQLEIVLRNLEQAKSEHITPARLVFDEAERID
jgi:hypothetical protein